MQRRRQIQRDSQTRNRQGRQWADPEIPLSRQGRLFWFPGFMKKGADLEFLLLSRSYVRTSGKSWAIRAVLSEGIKIDLRVSWGNQRLKGFPFYPFVELLVEVSKSCLFALFCLPWIREFRRDMLFTKRTKKKDLGLVRSDETEEDGLLSFCLCLCCSVLIIKWSAMGFRMVNSSKLES